jgi:RNA polymerase sigma-70 factor (family 1)
MQIVTIKTLSDEELLTLLTEGEEKAYAEIYTRYHSLLYIYAYRKLHHKQEAQDIIHDVLASLWNNRNTLNLSGSLASYLYTAVRNKAFDLFSHRKIEERYMASLQEFIDENEIQTDFLIRENDLKALIEKEIENLPPRMREAFRLSRMDKLSHREIAGIMDISEHTVSTQIKKALRILRMRLEASAWIVAMFSERL